MGGVGRSEAVMKRRTGVLIVAFACGVVLTAPRPGMDAAGWREPLWSVLGGGGGRATGPNVAVDVVIGQPLAGPTTGVNRVVLAGFLQDFSVQRLTQFVPFIAKQAPGG